MSDPAASSAAVSQPVIVWGTSGHAAAVVDVLAHAPRFHLHGFVDDVHVDRHGQQRWGASVLGDSGALSTLRDDGVRHLFVAIGDNRTRRDCAARAMAAGFSLPTLTDPHTHIGGRVEIAAGTVVMPHACVIADAQIGQAVIINTGAIIEHNVCVEDGVHIGPGAVISGWAQIRQGAWVGAGAVIRDRVTVGAGAIVGAGAVVVRDVPADVVVVGVPARFLKSTQP
jgi:sugar O-acyltransferase (sialic acid O-acetyltransferase NeuD family)